MRIDKLLSNLKYGSRKEVASMVKKGRISVNGNPIKKASMNIDPNTDKVQIDDEVIYYNESVILMMNKPEGYVCANHDALHKTVVDLIGHPYDRLDLNIVGRLDLDTTGLLLLTNDGQFIHDIISPSKKVPKTYLVTTKEPFLNPKVLEGKYQIEDGRGRFFQPLNVEATSIDEHHLKVTIYEGKYHQVKNMVAHFKNEVTELSRISIGSLELDKNLKTSEYRELTKKERQLLFD